MRVKLGHIKELLAEREHIAWQYLNGITNSSVVLPKIALDCTHVWHLFVVMCSKRNELINYLADKGIQTLIHYPIPPHLAEAYKDLGHFVGKFPITERYANEVLSLPLYNGMSNEEIEYVINCINAFR